MKRLLAILLLVPALALGAAPVAYKNSGALAASATGCTPSTTGASWVANDILLVVVETENQAVSLATANNYVEVGNQANQAAGTGGTDPASRLAVYWKRAVGSNTTTDPLPVTNDSGDHQTCRIYVFSGAVTSGDPWETTASGNDSGANDQSGTIPGVTTTLPYELIVLITSTSYNANTSSECSFSANASVTGLTEQRDETSTIQNGGGHCLATAYKVVPGTVSATSVSLSHTSYKGALTIALKPQAPFSITDAANTPLTGTVASPATSYSFTAPDGALIAVISSVPYSEGNIVVTSTKTSGAGTLASTLTLYGTAGNGTGYSQVAVSYGFVTGGSWTGTITSNDDTYSEGIILTVFVFSGASTDTPFTSFASSSGSTGTPSVSVTAARTGSRIIGGIAKYDDASAPNPSSGLYLVHDAGAGTGRGWTLVKSVDTSAGVAQTVGDGSSAAAQWAVLGVEVQAPITCLSIINTRGFFGCF